MKWPCCSARSRAACWPGWTTCACEPQRILDLGCGTAPTSPALHARYPGALLIGADFCENMLRASQASRSRLRWLMPFLRRQRTPLLAADAGALPFPPQSIGLLWSKLMLHLA
nr:methyltransferase domain-containing protein [Candidatus Accumulibacter sp. ACC012]